MMSLASNADNSDPAWVLAVGKRDWYFKAARRTNTGNVVSQVLVLLAGAATTISAGVGAPVLVTAPLAGFSFLLTGVRSAFNLNRLAVGRSVALRELEAATSRYEIVPPNLRTEECQRKLLERVFTIISEEQGAWALFRRKDESP
jgi:hypothetical protein